jgi:chromosome segregation protein
MKFSRLRLLGFKSFVEPVRIRHRARPDRRRRAEWLRQVEPCRGAALGDGRELLQEHARVRHGRRHLLRLRPRGPRATPPKSRCSSTIRPHRAAAFNDADELQVSRRIEREAGSVYRINGKEARAKDVQLLFADQSTGARSPSMVGQGRIGELIQAKPQARRALLEEAAGISGLHSRRHEAELRLRAAEQNLERLDDVVGELQAQIESLKRQARQASRFKNLSADIRKAEAILLHLRWTQAKARKPRRSRRCRRPPRWSATARRADERRQGSGGRRASPAGTARCGSRRRRGVAAPDDRRGQIEEEANRIRAAGRA